MILKWSNEPTYRAVRVLTFTFTFGEDSMLFSAEAI